MVALHRPDALPAPPDDGLPTRPIKPHSLNKIHFWGNYVQATSTAMRSFPQRVYVDLFAACGICEDTMTGERSWGTAPVALQVATPFDVYFFNDNDAELADALAEGVERIGVQGASVLKLDLREDGALHHARDLGKVVVPFGRKIIVATGDANEAHHALKQILEPGRRYVCAGTSPAPGSLRHGALAPLLPPDQLSLARMNAGL